MELKDEAGVNRFFKPKQMHCLEYVCLCVQYVGGWLCACVFPFLP